MLGITPRRAAASTVAVAMLVSAGAAVASRSAHRSPAGGASPPWVISVGAPERAHARALTPGGPAQALPFTITAARDGQTVRRIAPSIAAVAPRGDAESNSGAVIRGCLARWFRIVADPGDPPLPTLLKHVGSTYRGRLDVTMINVAVDQDACARRAPAVLLAAAG